MADPSWRSFRKRRPSPAGTGTMLSVAIGCTSPPCTCSQSRRPAAGSMPKTRVSPTATTCSRPPTDRRMGDWYATPSSPSRQRLSPGGEVEAGDGAAARGPERDHEHAPGHDRGRAEPVEGQLRALARHEVHGPQLAAGGRVEAEEVAARPEAEDPSAAQGRRRDRAVERAVPARERRRDRVAPELLPGARVEGRRHVLAAVGEEGDGAALGHRDRGVAGAERGAPGHGEAGPFRGVEGRERGAVVPGAPQAGPVRGVGHRHAREGARRRQNGEGFHRESVRAPRESTSRGRGRGAFSGDRHSGEHGSPSDEESAVSAPGPRSLGRYDASEAADHRERARGRTAIRRRPGRPRRLDARICARQALMRRSASWMFSRLFA